MNPYESKVHKEPYSVEFFRAANYFMRWLMLLTLAVYGLISLMHDTKIVTEDKDGYPHFFFEKDLEKYIRDLYATNS